MTDRKHLPWLIFDFDDTLGGILHEGQVRGNEVAYWIAIDNFVEFMKELGFDPEKAKSLQQEIDQHLCTIHGFSWKPRFAESMVRTYKTLASRAKKPTTLITENTVHNIGMSVFEYRYMPLPGALFTLNALYPHYRISVVTKGEVEEQTHKVVSSGVSKFVDDITAVGYKNIEDWITATDKLGIGMEERPSVWAIGNSPKSDVNVPLRMGMNAIHVKQGGWSFEQEEYTTPQEGCKLIVVDKISEVLNHIKWS